jgi:hypothetical protein
MEWRDHLQNHADLLRIREKWAVRLGLLFVVLFVVGVGLIWFVGADQPGGPVTVHELIFIVVTLFLAAEKAAELSTVRTSLELIDVMQRALLASESRA